MNRKLAWLLPLALNACVSAQPSADSAESLAAAERAFSRDAEARTVNDAFLTAFSDDAVMFRPTPVNAFESLKQRPFEATMRLRWTPLYAETSSDGTMGFTTGPSEAGTRGSPPNYTGYYVSVWQRTGGQWKVIFDAGSASPAQQTLEKAFTRLKTRSSERRFALDGGLVAAEQTLTEDYPARLRTMGASDLRLYREGKSPSTTLNEALAIAGSVPAVQFVPGKVAMAPSGDLGYVYGVADPGTPRARGYVRIYRRTQSDAWKVVVDLN